MPVIPIPTELFEGDLHVVGLDTNGNVIQLDTTNGENEPYTTGQDLAGWGLFNLRASEVTALLALDGIRQIDRDFLLRWHEGITEYESDQIADQLGYP